MTDYLKSSTFCILPWLHARIQQDGHVYPCCRQRSFYKYGSLHEKNFDEIWNDQAVKEVRLKMLKGEQLDFCQGCYSVEAAGGESLRQSSNRRYANEFGRISRTAKDGSIPANDNVLYLDLRFSNLCNLKCRSCNPENSSAWYGDAKKISGVDNNEIVRPYKESVKFVSFLEEKIPALDYVYFAGGEPLLDDVHYLFLEKLIEQGKTDVELFYNTNFTVLKHKHWNVLDLWKKFKRISVQASIDGSGEQVELLRKGLSWQTICGNFRNLSDEVPHAHFFVNPTITVMNAFHMPSAIRSFIDLGMIQEGRPPSLNVTHDPAYLSINVLNENERKLLKESYREFLKKCEKEIASGLYESISVEMYKVLMSFSDEVWNGKRKTFRHFTIALDKIRGEKFVKLFPELFDLIYSD